MPSKSVIYYTSNQVDEKILLACQEQLRKAFTGNIVACSLEPIDFGDTRIVLPLQKSYFTMFKQILAALEASTADIIFHCEHDNLMHPSHFDFTPPDKAKFYYDINWWKIRKDGLAVHWDAAQVSGLCYYRELGIKFYKERIAEFDYKTFDRKFEPTVDTGYETWWADFPSIDIRHDQNITYNKWKLDHFRKKDTAVNFTESRINKIPGWDLNDIIQLWHV